MNAMLAVGGEGAGRYVFTKGVSGRYPTKIFGKAFYGGKHAQREYLKGGIAAPFT